MALLRDQSTESEVADGSSAIFSPMTLRARESVQPGRVRAWIRQNRPPYQLTERSWFVMLAAVCVGIAMVFEPAIFVVLAVIFGLTAWWRRESARQGILTVAIGAFALGIVFVFFSIIIYILQIALN